MITHSLKLNRLFLFLIFIGGYASLALELIVLRNLSSFVGNTSVTASIIIGTVLLFMALGYYKGSIYPLKKRVLRKTLASSFLWSGVLAFLSASFLISSFLFACFYDLGVYSNLTQTFIFSFLMLTIPSFLFGRITALISRYFHRTNPHYTGKILALDTIGSFLGSLLTTLVLMPFIGVNHTVTLLVFVLFLSYLLLKKKKLLSSIFPLFILLLSLAINSNTFLNAGFNIVENNAVSTIALIPQDEGKSTLITINGSLAAKSSLDNEYLFPYINYIEENFIETMPQDEKKDILILGAGAFVLGKSDTFHNYTYVDIEKTLQPISEELFGEKLTPNKTFIVQDANQFLKETKQKYDFIVIDVYGAGTYIPMDFVTKEFFTRVQSRLKENAFMTMNIIAKPMKTDDFSQKIENSLFSVFGSNLSKIIPERHYNPWVQKFYNVLYTVYNKPQNNHIYTVDKNTLLFDNIR